MMIHKIMDELHEAKPQILVTFGINNKKTYFDSDTIIEVLEKHLKEEYQG